MIAIKSTNQPIHQPIHQPINQSFNQSINQSADRSIMPIAISHRPLHPGRHRLYTQHDTHTHTHAQNQKRRHVTRTVRQRSNNNKKEQKKRTSLVVTSSVRFRLSSFVSAHALPSAAFFAANASLVLSSSCTNRFI